MFNTCQEKYMAPAGVGSWGYWDWVWTGVGVMYWWREWVGEEGRLEGLICNVSDACSMLSHTCISCYFPRFLLSVWSLTHMNIAFLMVQE